MSTCTIGTDIHTNSSTKDLQLYTDKTKKRIQEQLAKIIKNKKENDGSTKPNECSDIKDEDSTRSSNSRKNQNNYTYSHYWLDDAIPHINYIKSFLEFHNGWDGENAKRFDSVTITKAIQFIGQIYERASRGEIDLPIPEICPTINGNIGITFQSTKREAIFTIDKNYSDIPYLIISRKKSKEEDIKKGTTSNLGNLLDSIIDLFSR